MTKKSAHAAGLIHLYLDVSELLAHSLHTGIQRVTRQIVTRAMAAGAARGLEVIPVVAVSGRFHALHAPGLAALTSSPDGRSGSKLTVDSRVARAAKMLLKPVPALYRQVQELHFQWRIKRRLTGLYNSTPIFFRIGDVVVLIDSFWGGSTAVQAAEKAVGAGAKAVAVVYDMIPVSHPQFCDTRLVRSFQRTLVNAAHVCSGFVTISKSVSADVEAFMMPRTGAKPVTHFYLGSELGGAVENGEHGRHAWPSQLWNGDGSVYLVVGTIEPRKQHDIILRAFEAHWANGGTRKLLIIGKIGWQVDAFIERCRVHEERGLRLFLIHDASDDALATAFERANACIIASAIEGFGLPLVEALAKGLTVIASNIPVFREIADEHALFFENGNVADLQRAIEQAEATKKGVIDGFRWIGWNEATEQFLDAVEQVTGVDNVADSTAGTSARTASVDA